MRVIVACLAVVLVSAAAAPVRSSDEPPAPVRSSAGGLVPRPSAVTPLTCRMPFALDRPVRVPLDIDPGGLEIVSERWRGLGIPAPLRVARAALTFERVPPARGAMPSSGYELVVGSERVTIRSGTAEGAFDALATLAQLPEQQSGRWVLPCVRITDAPAMPWRIVSDDVSRGPLPTARYFKERIRTLAAFKVNGYSPYMEQVFADPAHPYVAFPEAITAAELHDLAAYARRFHVTLIPEQQTLAHMHESLKWEALATLAELPHGYLLSPSDPGTYAYLEPLLRAELAATRPVPFFHLGADEPIDLGRGRTPRTAAVFAAHVRRVGAVVRAGGARPMIWDDAIQRDPSILQQIPRDTAIVTFHYGAEPSFTRYIATVDRAGFDQLVAPGANNWNEIFPDLDTAYAGAARFVADAKAAHSAHVLGLFETVWHDDGESLYEATWAPVVFAAASAWQRAPVDRSTWHRDFARAFFGSNDPRFGSDLDALAAIRSALRTPPESDASNVLFWSDPFDERSGARLRTLDVAAVRRRAEAVFTHLAGAAPPLHRNAAAVMELAALRYDALGRRAQIGGEVQADYADALTQAAVRNDDLVYRDLNVAKYLCWELRDELTAIWPLFARAWSYESRPGGLERVRVRYASAEAAALRDADRIDAAEREDYARAHTLPAFEALGLRP